MIKIKIRRKLYTNLSNPNAFKNKSNSSKRGKITLFPPKST